MPSFYALMGVPQTGFDPYHTFTTSWLLTPILLASLRTIIALYCFATIFAIWGWDGTHGHSAAIGQTFSYFTSLTAWGLAFYFLFSGIHTFVYAIKGYSWLQRWPRPLQALHSLFYSTVVAFPFLVTLVFWILIWYPPWLGIEDEWSNVSQHALNSLFALLEILLPATNPPPWLHLPFLILILLLYLAVAYITYATQGFYVYTFLNIKKNGSGTVTAYCFGILAAITIIFLIAWSAIWLRRRFTGAGKTSKNDGNAAMRGRVSVDENSSDDPEMMSREPK